MGGGDLNMKKSWHPVLLVNQERVWKAEKSANEEKKKLAQLRKEQEEERQLAELQRLQEQSTGKKRVDKLDWMYAAPSNEGGALGGARISETMMEDYLLGKRRVDEVLAQNDKNIGNAHKEFIAVQNANSARDTASKIREDPLLAIRRQEQAALAAMANRPDIRRQLKAMKKDKDETKEERKARKRAEKEEKKRVKHERSSRYRDEYSRSPKSEYSDERDRRHPSRRDDDRYDRSDRYDRWERESHDHRRRDRSRSSSPRRDRRRDDSPPRRYRDDRDHGRDRDERSRDHRSNASGSASRDHDNRIPPPRHYPNEHHETKPHPSRPSAMDMADRPTSSRPNGPNGHYNGKDFSNGSTPQPQANGGGGGGGGSLDEMRAARLAAMSSSADQLYSQRTKSLAQRAEEEQREKERDEKMRAKYGKDVANAGFFKQQEGMGLGETLSRRGGKGLQRDI